MTVVRTTGSRWRGERPINLHVNTYQDAPHLNMFEAYLGSSCSYLGHLLGRFGFVVPHLGPVLPHLGTVLALLGLVLAHLGPVSAHLGSWKYWTWGDLESLSISGIKKVPQTCFFYIYRGSILIPLIRRLKKDLHYFGVSFWGPMSRLLCMRSHLDF